MATGGYRVLVSYPDGTTVGRNFLDAPVAGFVVDRVWVVVDTRVEDCEIGGEWIHFSVSVARHRVVADDSA